MATSARWEYKTIPTPSMDPWLVSDQGLALDAASGRGHEKVIRKHAAYVDQIFSDLGHEGWELVSVWESGPSQLFRFSVQWMTFKRQVA